MNEGEKEIAALVDREAKRIADIIDADVLRALEAERWKEVNYRAIDEMWHYWLPWFAWRPVRLRGGGWAWLTTVERRAETCSDWDNGPYTLWHSVYRKAGPLPEEKPPT